MAGCGALGIRSVCVRPARHAARRRRDRPPAHAAATDADDDAAAADADAVAAADAHAARTPSAAAETAAEGAELELAAFSRASGVGGLFDPLAAYPLLDPLAAAEASSECNSELTLSSSNSGLSLHQPGGAAAAARPASPRDPLASLTRSAVAKEHRLRGRRLLRHCGCDCAAEPPNPAAEPPAATVAGGGDLGAWLQSALDACEHSPFGAALLAKQAACQPASLQPHVPPSCRLVHPGCTPVHPGCNPLCPGRNPM